MDILVRNDGASWYLEATSDRGAAFLGVQTGGGVNVPYDEGKRLCDEARRLGLGVSTTF